MLFFIIRMLQMRRKLPPERVQKRLKGMLVIKWLLLLLLFFFAIFCVVVIVVGGGGGSAVIVFCRCLLPGPP